MPYYWLHVGMASSLMRLRRTTESNRKTCSLAGRGSGALACVLTSTEKDVTRLLKVAWVTLPLGIAVTIAACVFVLWWQSLSYSDTYAQSILIHVLPKADPSRRRKVGPCDDNQQKKKKLGTCLTEALKLVMLIGLIFMAFGPSYSYSLIRLLYGEKWSDGEASFALQFYCLYIIVLAMNGTSEAFLHAVGTEDQLKRSNDMLLVFSLIYIVLNILLIRSAGAIGLILANSLNMIGRIIYSGQFIQRYFKGDASSPFSFRKCFPSGWQILILSGIITIISEKAILDHKNFWATFPLHFASVSSAFVSLPLSYTGVRECLSIESYVSGIMMTDIINQETGGLNTAK
ncbi:hypothetical protein Bca52824_069888 [Brassica carinata]|uniref:Protein RFT1 homolog n=1 Tax=Brassica carinata TaxID=52824 RepID=A0A8X7Q880_BRACI|nr:hypothetical protein Bca52824_069888 [Brassica carinata]